MSGHRLPDILDYDLDVIFVGTAAGKRAAKLGHYYAGPGNRFWPTLFEVGLTPRCFKPEEFRQLLDLRIGLTDLSKLGSGIDHEIEPEQFDLSHFKKNLQTYRPRAIAFTSKKTAALATGVRSTRRVQYGRQPKRDGMPEMFVLTSPSGAARSYWDIAPWAELSSWLTTPRAQT